MSEAQVRTRHEAYADEIDMADIIRFFWDVKFKLILGGIMGLILGGLAWFLVSDKKIITGSFSPLSASEFVDSGPLAATPFISFSPNSLYLALFGKTQDQAELFEVYEENNLWPEDVTSYEEKVRALETVEFARREPGRSEADSFAELLEKVSFSIEANNSEEAVTKAKLMVTALSDKVRKEQILLFEAGIRNHRQNQSYQIDDINRQLSNLDAEYNAQTDLALAQLNEQAQIARNLGIAEPVQGASARNQDADAPVQSDQVAAAASSGDSINVFLDNNRPLYYRGYLSLETELAAIRDRPEPELFIPERVSLEAKLRAIEQDTAVERAQAALDQSVLADGKAIVSFERNSIRIESKFSRLIFLAVGLLSGGFLAFMILVLGRILSRPAEA